MFVTAAPEPEAARELAVLVDAVTGYRPKRLPTVLARSRAAVAVLVRSADVGPELLLVERAERHGDPWSGNMAFPGGLAAPKDSTLDATAARETLEEVGIDLGQCARRIGTLSERLTLGHDRRPLVVSPRVFMLETAVEASIGAEVRSVHWVPLGIFRRPEHHARLSLRYLGIPMSFECYRHEGLPIWGLTLRMVQELVRLSNRARGMRER